MNYRRIGLGELSGEVETIAFSDADVAPFPVLQRAADLTWCTARQVVQRRNTRTPRVYHYELALFAGEMPVYRHIKTGGLYRVLRHGRIEADLRAVVIYESLADGRVWVRPTDEFYDGRFEYR